MCLAHLMKTFCALSKSMAHFTWTSVGPGIYPNNLEEDHMVKGLRIVFLPSLWNIKWIKEDKWKSSFYWSECEMEQRITLLNEHQIVFKISFLMRMLYFLIISESNCFWSFLLKNGVLKLVTTWYRGRVSWINMELILIKFCYPS